MGSVFVSKSVGSAVESLGDQALLDKIDRLRELNVGAIVSLPQLIAVGDQSSGKSSVLESLTGFSFPRAPGLCTRYATQITCRRDPHPSVSVSIIPRPSADDALQARLRKFRRYVGELRGHDFTEIFEDANRAMGIRPICRSTDEAAAPPSVGDSLVTFSEDILKIEINGPDKPALTVIDVPGIFRSPTPGLTTDTDISLVTSMVKRYMKDSRTIILAVIPCNVDIATQEILKLAKDADPSGFRTMGVLTKPDLAPEWATQQNIIDLIAGKREDLKLGYCVVKNRGADDKDSTLENRNEEERVFFLKDPWSVLASSGRVGVRDLQKRSRGLLMDISKREFPTVKSDIQKKLADCSKKFESMGASRSDEKAQRAYLGKIAASYEKIVGYSLNAYYTEDTVFEDRLEMRLITRIIELNEIFRDVFSQRGHTRVFELSQGPPQTLPDELPKPSFEFPEDLPELADIIVPARFECQEPCSDSLTSHIEATFSKSRGPELGTFGGSLLATTFKEQSKRWEDIVMYHTSDTIMIVHQYIVDLLDHIVPDEQVKESLYGNVLLEKLQASYKRAMEHARFLLSTVISVPSYQALRQPASARISTL